MEPCYSGVYLQELKKFFAGGPSVNSFFQCGPPFDSMVEIFFSSWRSRSLEHGSTHHIEALTIKLSEVLSFDRMDFAKIDLCADRPSQRVSHKICEPPLVPNDVTEMELKGCLWKRNCCRDFCSCT